MTDGLAKIGITLSPEKNKAMYDTYDENKDGNLNQMEFANMIIKNKGGNAYTKEGITAILKSLA